jgi:histidinol-phosphate aminotransferase
MHTLQDLKAPRHLAGVTQFVPGISDWPIERIKVRLGLDSVIKLSFNENPWGPSPNAVEAAIRAVQAADRYPEGPGGPLRTAIAAWEGVAEEQITLGNGADELISMVSQLLEPGDEAVIPAPTFGQYVVSVRLAGGEPRIVSLEGHEIDLFRARGAVGPRTRLVFLCNPNNPTGRFLPFTELERFASDLPSHVTLVVDEAYFDFVDDPSVGSAIRLIGQRKGPVMVIRTFSKIHALAGLRVGYGIANAALIQLLERIRLPFNTNAAGQAAALASLEDTAYYEKSRRLILQERASLYAGLERLSELGVRPVRSVTNFLLVEFGRRTDQLWQALLGRGIVTRRGADVGLPDALRVTVGRPEENAAFLTALRAILPKWHI